jgi:hypothetical protein
MAKADKAIPEEVLIEDEPRLVQALETPEQREERLKREDYQRRNLEAIKDRERIFRENKLIGPDEPFTMDPDAAVNQRCCF